MLALRDTLRELLGGRRLVLLFGMLATKDYHAVTALIAPLAHQVVTTRPDNPHALRPGSSPTRSGATRRTCVAIEDRDAGSGRGAALTGPDDVLVVTGRSTWSARRANGCSGGSPRRGEKVTGAMWVDQLAEELLRQSPGSHVVNDAKTPSGHVPVAHLRGVLMHDCVARALRDAGVETSFLYGFDDYDPMDDLPPSLPEYGRYMGMPFSTIPSPDGRASSYGHYYAEEFAEAFQRLGARPTSLPHHRHVPRGQFDDGIRRALDQVETIREIYRDVAHSKRIDDRWWPVQVVCERCGRIGTTSIVAWDGREVEYVCEPTRWCGPRGAGTAANGARSAAPRSSFTGSSGRRNGRRSGSRLRAPARTT